jgi:hypothetical protein
MTTGSCEKYSEDRVKRWPQPFFLSLINTASIIALHQDYSSPLMNADVTGPTALVFKYEVEPQKDNKQL